MGNGHAVAASATRSRLENVNILMAASWRQHPGRRSSIKSKLSGWKQGAEEKA